MRGFFSLEGAKQELGVTEAIETSLSEREEAVQAEEEPKTRLLWEKEAQTRWAKLDHLLYLPVLGLTRPHDLYYYQQQGLRVLYGFTYKYQTVEHFLGRLTRLEVGQPIAAALAQSYSQAWYGANDPLFIFVDWHLKPHWTKQPAQSGHVTMLKRVMPGTKQLILNGPEGHLLGAWNKPIDSHLSGELVDLEAELADTVQRPIDYTICDSEGGGLPLGQRYAAAERYYLSLLPQQGYKLTDFTVVDSWQPVTDDPQREVVAAGWHSPLKAKKEVRDLVLMRRGGDTEPTRVYTGRLPPDLALADVPGQHRQRWANQERVIRELVNGANLNANYGYSYQQVPNRTVQRRWAEAQEKVEHSEQYLQRQQQAISNLQQQLVSLRQQYQQQQALILSHLRQRQAEFAQRHDNGQVVRRLQQQLVGQYRKSDQAKLRYQRRRGKLLAKLGQHRTQRKDITAELTHRQTTRNEIDTDTLYRERNLEKDQIMLNLQVLLGNLHHWTRHHYLAPLWQRLELKTAINMIYRKPGWVQWGTDQIDVLLESYTYPEQQQAMEETCRRFNAANIRWRDGRLLFIRVAPP